MLPYNHKQYEVYPSHICPSYNMNMVKVQPKFFGYALGKNMMLYIKDLSLCLHTIVVYVCSGMSCYLLKAFLYLPFILLQHDR